MNNAERFIDIYNRVDELMRDRDSVYYESYAIKIKNSTNPIVVKYRHRLIDFGELRNALIHNPKIDGKYLAMPLDEVVDEFEMILNKLKNPIFVYPMFKNEVVGFKITDKLQDLFHLMKNKTYSQYPIFDDKGNIIEIINANTIVRWLGKNMDDNMILIENPTIQDLIQHIEFRNNFRFVSRYSDVYEASNMFISHMEKNNVKLDVIFITENGNKTGKILGLITLKDLAGKV